MKWNGENVYLIDDYANYLYKLVQARIELGA